MRIYLRGRRETPIWEAESEDAGVGVGHKRKLHWRVWLRECECLPRQRPRKYGKSKIIGPAKLCLRFRQPVTHVIISPPHQPQRLRLVGTFALQSSHFFYSEISFMLRKLLNGPSKHALIMANALRSAWVLSVREAIHLPSHLQYEPLARYQVSFLVCCS